MHQLEAHPVWSYSVLAGLGGFLAYLIYEFHKDWPLSEERLNELRAQELEGNR